MQTGTLKREVSLLYLIFYGVGNILGAGIYVLIGKMAGISGIYVPLSFIAACIVVFFTALSYAELSARYPLSAGEAVYVYEGFGTNILPIIIGLLIAFSGILSSATLLHGFYGYFAAFADIPETITVTMLMILLTLIAVWGIKASVKAAAFLTLIEIFGLLLVIYVVVVSDIEIPIMKTLTPSPDLSLFYTLFLGAFLAFYAFIGFEDMVNIAEEIKNPEKTLPKAIIFALIVSMLLYVAVAIVSVSAIAPEQLAQSEAPLADVYQAATGKEPMVLSIIGMFAVINGALIQMIMVSRIFYGMGKKKWLPEIFASVHPKRHTPVFSTAVVAFLILVFTFLLPIVTLAQMTSFLIFIIFTIVNLSLIRIKRKYTLPKGIKTYPIWIPMVAVFLNSVMLFLQISSFL